MEFRSLRYSLEVAQKKSFTKAASSLHISQPALSKQISLLEEELGRKLFIRQNRGLELTEAGKILHRKAQAINDLVLKTEEEFQSGKEFVTGNIKIGLANNSMSQTVRNAVSNFAQEFPNAQITLAAGSSEELKRKLEANELSFVISTEPETFEQFDALILNDARKWGVTVLAADEISRQKNLSLEDLKQMPLAFPDSLSVKNLLSGWMANNSRRVNRAVLYKDGAEVTELALNGIVKVFGLEPSVLPAVLKFIPIEPVMESRTIVLYNKYHILSFLESRFLDLLRE